MNPALYQLSYAAVTLNDSRFARGGKPANGRQCPGMLAAILFIALMTPGLCLIIYVVIQGLRGKADEPTPFKPKDRK